MATKNTHKSTPPNKPFNKTCYYILLIREYIVFVIRSDVRRGSRFRVIKAGDASRHSVRLDERGTTRTRQRNPEFDVVVLRTWFPALTVVAQLHLRAHLKPQLRPRPTTPVQRQRVVHRWPVTGLPRRPCEQRSAAVALGEGTRRARHTFLHCPCGGSDIVGPRTRDRPRYLCGRFSGFNVSAVCACVYAYVLYGCIVTEVEMRCQQRPTAVMTISAHAPDYTPLPCIVKCTRVCRE